MWHQQAIGDRLQPVQLIFCQKQSLSPSLIKTCTAASTTAKALTSVYTRMTSGAHNSALAPSWVLSRLVPCLYPQG